MNRRLLMLSSAAVLLAAFMMVERAITLHAEESSGPPPAVPSAAVDGPPLNPLQDLTPESFTAIVERPLFNPSRSPRPLEQQAPPPVPVDTPPPVVPLGPRAEDFKLVGISSGPTGRIAALRLAAGGDVIYVQEGQPVQSWTALAINGTSVVIGSEQASITLSLFHGGAGAPMPAPASVEIPPLSEDIESANDAYHAATEEFDPYANNQGMQ